VTTSRVGECVLRIRVPAEAAARASALQATAERSLIRGVLDALDAEITARLGPRAIVRIRRLPLRWALGAGELGDAAVHRRLAIELADVVLDVAGVIGAAIPSTPPRDASFVVFADEAHALAVALAERAAGAPAAFHHPARTVPALWEVALGAADPAVVAGVLTWLEALGADAAIAGAPAAVVARRRAAAAPSAAIAVRAPGAIDPRAATAASPPSPQASETPVTESPRSLAIEPAADPLRAAPTPVTDEHSTVGLDRAPTAIAGAAMLVGRTMELEIAEALWCAGVPEGPVIAAAIARLAGPAHARDPILAAIAAAQLGPPPPLPGVPAWAATEVTDKLRDSLGRWLARRRDVRAPAALTAALAAVAAELAAADGPALDPLVDAIAAALAASACTRLARAWSAATARWILVRAGEVTIPADTAGRDADAIEVALPMAAVDLELRRAGLDADPGWLPWLSRRMRLVFVPGAGDVF
jgi:hypothetical protein